MEDGKEIKGTIEVDRPLGGGSGKRTRKLSASMKAMFDGGYAGSGEDIPRVTVEEMHEVRETVRMHSLRLEELGDEVRDIRIGAEDIIHDVRLLDGVVTENRTGTDARLDGVDRRLADVERMLADVADRQAAFEVLRDRVGSQEAVIAGIEEKVAKMETEVGETFAEAGRMIRDVKDESAQKVEEISRAMETRLMERTQEDTEARLKEATRIQDKDITVMKQRMEGVFSRMKRVEEDPTVKVLRGEIELIRRDMRVAVWAMALSLATSVGLMIAFGLKVAGVLP